MPMPPPPFIRADKLPVFSMAARQKRFTGVQMRGKNGRGMLKWSLTDMSEACVATGGWLMKIFYEPVKLRELNTLREVP